MQIILQGIMSRGGGGLISSSSFVVQSVLTGFSQLNPMNFV